MTGATRRTVPQRGPGDFDPYAPLAAAWVMALRAKVVVELGVRFGDSTRALLSGVAETGGRLWGVDRNDIHGIDDSRFHFVHADAAAVADRWEAIDLLHVDIDPHGEDDARRWLESYAARCRAIAVHDTHHPRSRLGPVIAARAAVGDWQVFEYRGNAAGWTVLLRPGEPSPDEDAATSGGEGRPAG